MKSMADYALGNFNILIYKIINDFLQIFEKNTSIAYWKDFQNFNFHLKLQKTSLKICKQVLLNSCVQVLPWTGLIAIERASPIDQLRSGFILNRPDCNCARKSYWKVPFRFALNWPDSRLNSSVQVLPLTGLIVIERASRSSAAQWGQILKLWKK